MGTYNRFTEEEVRRIVVAREFGLTQKQIGEKVGRAENTIGRVIMLWDAAGEGNEIRTANMISKAPQSETLARLVYKAAGVDFPEETVRKVQEEKARAKEIAKEKEAAEPLFYVEERKEEPVEEATHEAEAVTAPYIVQHKPQGQDGGLYLAKLLETLAQTNELLEQLMDVVLPRYAGDIKDNINANSDVLTQQMKSCGEALNRLVINTRKRGL